MGPWDQERFCYKLNRSTKTRILGWPGLGRPRSRAAQVEGGQVEGGQVEGNPTTVTAESLGRVGSGRVKPPPRLLDQAIASLIKRLGA